MSDDITNKDLAQAVWDLYPNGPSIGLKLLLQEALRRLVAAPDGAAVEDASEWQDQPATVSAQADASGTVQESTSASANDTGPEPVAQDTPVARMPTSSVERARLRLGHRDGGKTRP